ncbi:MAG: TolC family protein [Desulfobacterales bacterium]|nr:TolC family protein [Desulfobacterales bacterium]
MKKLSAILALLLITTAPAGALTLKELQLEALSNRDTVQAAKAETDIQKQIERQAKSAFLPRVDATYKGSRLNKNTLTKRLKKSDGFQAAASINLFTGFKDSYTLKAAQKQTQASRYNLSNTLQEVSHSVALAYLGVYKSLKNLTVAESAAHLYRDRYRQMKLKYDVGVLKKRDLLKVKVEMDNALQEERTSRATVTSALNSLAFAVNRPFSEAEIKTLDFSLFEKVPSPMEESQGKELLLNNNSSLLAIRENLAASGFQKKAARAAYLPRVDLSAAYESYTLDGYTFDDPQTNGDNLALTATVSINLFDGLNKQAKISQAALEETALRHQLRETEKHLVTTFTNTILDRNVAEENLSVALSGLEAAEENLRVTDLAFAQGMATSTEVLDAIFNLSRARFNHITALTDLFAKHFDLLMLTQGYNQG